MSTSYLFSWVRVLTKVFTCTYWSEYLVLILENTRTYQSVYVYLLKWIPRIYSREYAHSLSWCCRRRAPTGRYFFIAQGASPGLGIDTHLLSSVGAALLQSQHKRPHPHNDTNQTCALKVPLLKELNPLLSACTQGFISGFALIPPWAMQEYRPKGLLYVFPITLLFWCGCY